MVSMDLVPSVVPTCPSAQSTLFSAGLQRGLTSRLELVKLLEVDVKDAIHSPMDDRAKFCSDADV